VASVTTSGTIIEYSIPNINTHSGPGLPWGIAAGPDGNLWFTENTSGRVGKVTTSGAFTMYTVASAYDDLGGITAGPDGRLCFTEGKPNKLAAISPRG